MEVSVNLEEKSNRIITYSVNGGFKRKEPQVQEMKDVWSFILEKLRERR